MQPGIHGGLEAPRRHLLQQLRPAARTAFLYNDLRPDPRRVRARAAQRHGQVGVVVDLAGAVAVDRRRRVDVVHHQVERAAVVQVHVDGAVGEARLGEPPRVGHVRERQVAVVVKCVVGDRDLRHVLEEREVLRGDPVPQGRLHRLVADVIDVIEVVGAAVNAVGDEEVLVAVVVEVGEQRGPAPVGRLHAGEVADVAEAPPAAVQLQRVAGVLGMIPGAQPHLEDREALGGRRRLEDALLVGQHVEDRDVRPAVVVDVGRIDAHREPARVPRRRCDRLPKRAVAVVVVEKVVLLKIVGDVEIGAAVAIKIARDHPQAVPLDAAVDVGLLADIREMAAVVAEQPVAGARVAHAAAGARADGALGVGRVVQQIHVEVAVAVVVEEHGLGRVTDVLEAELPGAVGEGAVAVVDVEHVVPVHPEIADRRDVDVDPAVAVHVGHRDARLPTAGAPPHPPHARPVGDVLEAVVALVEIEPVGAEVRREVEIGQAVVVDVARGHAAAVVVVEVVQDVEGRVFRQAILERDAGRPRRQQLEQARAGGAVAPGQRRDGKEPRALRLHSSAPGGCGSPAHPRPPARCGGASPPSPAAARSRPAAGS